MKPKITTLSKTINAIIKKTSYAPLRNVMVNENGINFINPDRSMYVTIKNLWGIPDGVHAPLDLGIVNRHELDTSEFPNTFSTYKPSLDHKKLITSVNELESFLNHSSKDETRLHLNSLAIKDGSLMACDGCTFIHRSVEGMGDSEFLVHNKDLEQLLKIIKRYRDIKNAPLELLFSESDNALYFQDELVQASIRLLNREYPRVSMFMSSNNEDSFLINHFIDFKEYKTFLKEFGFKAIIENINGDIVLKAPGIHLVIGESLSEKKVKFLVNLELMNRLFKDSKSVLFSFKNELSPIFFSYQGDSFTGGVIMPMKGIHDFESTIDSMESVSA